MAQTAIKDYTQTEEFYRIPKPVGEQEEKDLLAAIEEGERLFADTFKAHENNVSKENETEAVKFFVFAFWLKVQTLLKSRSGASAKVNYTQAENRYDQLRRMLAWNRACVLMRRKDLKMLKIMNY